MSVLRALTARLEHLVRGNSTRLRWVAIVAPTIFVAVVETARQVVLDGDMPGWAGDILVTGIVFGGAFFFSKFVFGLTTKMQREIIASNQQLAERNAAAATLNAIANEVSALLDPRQIAERLVFRTQGLLPVGFVRLSLLDESSRRMITLASTAGVFPAPGEICAPIRMGDKVVGELCAAGSGGEELSLWHVDMLTSLANQAAVALENARLYDQVQRLAVVEERERIAREMHDGLVQVLGYVITKTEAAKAYLGRNEVRQALLQLDQLAAAARDVYTDVREVILGLRNSLAMNRGFVTALRDYIERFAEDSGIETALVVGEGASELQLTPETELQLIRVVQEALANTRKHAKARHSVVEVGLDGGQVSLRISDDGKGFNVHRPLRRRRPQFGLQTMRERAEAVKGAFQVDVRLVMAHGSL